MCGSVSSARSACPGPKPPFPPPSQAACWRLQHELTDIQGTTSQPVHHSPRHQLRLGHSTNIPPAQHRRHTARVSQFGLTHALLVLCDPTVLMHHRLPSACSWASIATTLSSTCVKGGLQHTGRRNPAQTGHQPSSSTQLPRTDQAGSGCTRPAHCMTIKHAAYTGLSPQSLPVTNRNESRPGAQLQAGRHSHSHLSAGSLAMHAARRSLRGCGMSGGTCSRRPMPMACSTWLWDMPA